MPDELTFAHLLALLRRHLVWVLATGIVCAGVAYLVSAHQTSHYRASATILYSAPQSAVASTTVPDDRALATYVGLVKTNQVLSQAGAQVGMTPQAVTNAVGVTGAANADLLTITASTTSPPSAQKLANAVAQTFLAWRSQSDKALIASRISSLRNQLAHLQGQAGPAEVATAADLRTQLAEANAELAAPDTTLTLANPAQLPGQPYSPHPVRSLVIGLLAGLLLGMMAVFVLDRVDRRLHTVEEVELAFDAPVLGTVPFIKDAERGNRQAALASFADANALADAFRQIRTNLELFQVDGSKHRTIVVTSAIPGEGKSAVAANLALAFASRGRSVLALSADLRSPSLHEYFGTKFDDGLVRALLGERDLERAIRTISLNGSAGSRNAQSREKTGRDTGSLALLGTTQRVRDPAAVLQSESMAKLLGKAKESYDTIVIDAPPLLAGAEAHLLAQGADALILVSRIGKLTRNDVRRAVRTMHATELSAIGLVVTGRLAGDDAYGYGYGYGYGYSRPHEQEGQAHPVAPL